MSTTLTETASDADFGTGLLVPQPGVDQTSDAVVILKDNSLQQLADRSQAIQKLSGLNGVLTRTVHVPLNVALQNSSSRFTSGLASGIYWEQTSVASVGALEFAIPPLPVGAKITQVIARWGNDFNTTLAIGTPPAISLRKSGIATGVTFVSGIGNPTTIGTQSDTTAVVATYKALHNITLSVAETISADAVYIVRFTGETGSNSVTGGILAGVLLTVALP
jgi:hypothetical protein